MAEPVVPFRPGQYYGPGVAALAAAVEGLHGDLLAVLELLGGVDPGLMSQLTAAPVGTWQAVVEAARRQVAGTYSVPPVVMGESVERRVWRAQDGETLRPEERFWTRDRHGVREMWPPLETPGTHGRRMQRIDWNVALDERGPLTEITQEEYERDGQCDDAAG